MHLNMEMPSIMYNEEGANFKRRIDALLKRVAYLSISIVISMTIDDLKEG